MGVRLHNQDFGQLNVGRVTVTDFSFPKTQSGLAFERIRAMILDWSLQPGATIDEKTLGASLGMGRTPIREALLRLAEQGLVVFAPNKSMHVAELGLDAIRDLFEIRLHNDRLASRLFLSSATQDEKADVAGLFDAGQAHIDAGEHRALFDLDFTFHTRLVALARNDFLKIYHDNLTGHFFRIAFLTFYGNGAPTRDDMTRLLRGHDAMVEAIRTDDVQALDTATIEHCKSSYERVVSMLTTTRFSEISEMDVDLLGPAPDDAGEACQ